MFGSSNRITTELLVQRLNNLPEAPWGDLHGTPINDRTLAKLLRQYDIASTDVRTDSGTKKGYRREDLHDAWQRYRPCSQERATSATIATSKVTAEPSSEKSSPLSSHT